MDLLALWVLKYRNCIIKQNVFTLEVHMDSTQKTEEGGSLRVSDQSGIQSKC